VKKLNILFATCIGLVLTSANAATPRLEIGQSSTTASGFTAQKAASGDFDGDGIDEVALLDISSGNLSASSAAHKTLEQEYSYSLHSLIDNNTIAVTTGDVYPESGTKMDELIVLRNATDSSSPNVLVYRLNNNGMQLLTDMRISSGNYPWVDITAGNFDGNGLDEIVLAKTSWSQFILLATNSQNNLQIKSAGNISNLAAENNWKAIDSGDLDNDGRDELVTIRQGSGNYEDVLIWDIYDDNNWDFDLLTEYNHAYGNNHYPWKDVVVGEFDGNHENGEEFVLYKNSHSHFIFYGYQQNQVSVLYGDNFASNTSHPWNNIVAANTQLNNGMHELISVRSSAPAGQHDFYIYHNQDLLQSKKANLQKNGFMWGSYDQVLLSEMRDGTSRQTSTLNPQKLQQYINNNNLQFFNFLLSDSFVRGVDPLQTNSTGQEYLDLIRFLEHTKNTDIKVWVTLINPNQSYRYQNGARVLSEGPYKGSFPANSPYITGDESAHFQTLSGHTGVKDPLDYVAWFQLLGKVANQYPNLVAINVDDFSHNTNVFSESYMGKMLTNLRQQNQQIAFVPTAYYDLIQSAAKKYVRNYVDGITFYFRNQKARTNLNPQTGGWNMHGPGTENAYYLNGQGEVVDVKNWLAHTGKILTTGIYATSHSNTTHLPNLQTTQALMQKARTQTDGVMIYISQPSSSSMGATVHGEFTNWNN